MVFKLNIFKTICQLCHSTRNSTLLEFQISTFPSCLSLCNWTWVQLKSNSPIWRAKTKFQPNWKQQRHDSFVLSCSAKTQMALQSVNVSRQAAGFVYSYFCTQKQIKAQVVSVQYFKSQVEMSNQPREAVLEPAEQLASSVFLPDWMKAMETTPTRRRGMFTSGGKVLLQAN